jgi:hypothetical protein
MGIRGELFSTKVSLQNRTYFFNVKENRLGDLYLNIVESKNRDEGGFERQSVILFADDLQEFLKGFEESLRVLEKAAREKSRGMQTKKERPRNDFSGAVSKDAGFKTRENKFRERGFGDKKFGDKKFDDKNFKDRSFSKTKSQDRKSYKPGPDRKSFKRDSGPYQQPRSEAPSRSEFLGAKPLGTNKKKVIVRKRKFDN